MAHTQPWQQHVINTVLTAFLLGSGAFLYGHFTTDPEHNTTIVEVKRQQTVDEQHDETITLLTQAVAQQSVSVKGLAIDRAATVLEDSLKLKAEIELAHVGTPVEQWSEAEQERYLTALAQIKSAKERLGLSDFAPQ